MTILHLDIETYSEADLPKVGLYKYAEHPSTEITVCAWAFGNADVECWAHPKLCGPPDNVIQALTDPAVTKWAHNAAFETQLIQNCWGIELDIKQWRCTMALAYSLALPGSLAQVAPTIQVPTDQQKAKEGRRLIQKFAKPRKPSKLNPDTRWTYATASEDWALFVDYCKQDVIAEREVHRRLKRWDMSEQEWELWHLDQHINSTGLPVDMELVDACIQLNHDLAEPLTERSQRSTGLANPNSRAQLLPWLGTQGYTQTGLTALEVTTALDLDELTTAARDVLWARQQTSKTSVTKFSKLKQSVTKGDRLRGGFQFAGAGRTGRWGGRLVQPHNLPRGSIKPSQQDTAIGAAKLGDPDLMMSLYDSPADVLSSLVRPAFAAPEGQSLVVADLSSIESVMLAGLAGCESILDLFRNGKDTYKDFASKLFRVPYDQVTKEQRTYCKPPVLGCGYGLGYQGLMAYAEGFRVDMTEDQAREAVDVYRGSYPEIVELWRTVEHAFKGAIWDRTTTQGGPFRFIYDKPFVSLQLPNGRKLAYLRPRIEPQKTPWGEMKPTVTYEGMHQMTRQWTRLKTHGAKTVENGTQAVARDVLADGLTAAHTEGLQIVGHVHDEIIALAPIDKAARALAVLINCMTESSDWCADAPLNAAGWIGPAYRKD